MTRILSVFNLLKRVGFVFLFCLSCMSANSQELDWVQFYEIGEGAVTGDVVQIDDGYILVGSAAFVPEEGGNQALIIRTNERGEEIWHRTIGELGTDAFQVVLQVQDELWAFGITEDIQPFYYGLLVAFSMEGDSLWSRSYTELDTILLGFTEAVQASDGNIIVATRAGAIAIKLDLTGNILWAVHGPESHDLVTALWPTANGGAIVATNTYRLDQIEFPANAIVYWIDGDGSIEDSAVNSTELALVESVVGLNNDEVIVAGRAQNGGAFYTQGKFIFKMSRDGSIAWQHLGDVYPQSNAGVHLYQDTLYIVNYVHDFSLFPGAINVELYTTSGDSVRNIHVDTNPTGQDFVTVRGTLMAEPFAILITGESDYPGPNTPNRAYLARVGEPLDAADGGPLLPNNFALSVYPNPFNSTTEITFDIPRRSHATLKAYDVLGREVRTLLDDVVQSGTRTVKFDASWFSSGIYFVWLVAGDISATRKVALIR